MRRPYISSHFFWRRFAWLSLIVLTTLASLAIVFSLWDHETIAKRPGLERQIGKLATSVDRLTNLSAATTPLSSFQAFAATGDFARLTAKLTRREKRQLPGKLAQIFVAASGQRLGSAAVGDLTQVFEKLLTSSGAEASAAAGVLSSLASLLSTAEQAALPEKLMTAFGEGATKELGKKGIDALTGLFEKLDGGKPKPVSPESEIDMSLSFGNTVRFDLGPRVVSPFPTAFLWFNRTWGREDRTPFETEARAKHIEGKRLGILYECHPTVRKVLGVAAITRCTE